MYHSMESTQGVTLNSSTQVWPSHHNLNVVDYKALIGLSPLGPLVSNLCTLPPWVKYTPGVTLILVEFQASL
jgi:hypothetical protein